MADAEMSGTLKFTGGLLFEGKFNGGLIDGDLLIVGRGAEICAEIIVTNLTSFGRVEGEVEVLERCQLKAGSELRGSLTTARVAQEEGAAFTGTMQVSLLRGEKAQPNP